MPQRKNSNRMERVNEEFKKEISYIIDQKLKNSNITGLISVVKVKVSPDLREAKIYISILNSKSKKNTLEALDKSKGFIRSELARKINMKYTPNLSFVEDDSMEYGAKIENILKEIMPKKDEEN